MKVILFNQKSLWSSVGAWTQHAPQASKQASKQANYGEKRGFVKYLTGNFPSFCKLFPAQFYGQRNGSPFPQLSD